MRRIALAALFVVLPLNAALAHTGVGPTAGFAHGLVHPFSGLDHLLAMTLVGMLGVQIGGRAIWALPLTFVGMMVVGGVLGMTGIAILFVEAGIALSVLVLGAAVAFAWKPPVAAAIGAAALFALFHGHAHGAEMPASASGLSYSLGFIAATAALHGLGVALGLGVRRLHHGGMALRMAGAASAMAGVALLLGS